MRGRDTTLNHEDLCEGAEQDVRQDKHQTSEAIPVNDIRRGEGINNDTKGHIIRKKGRGREGERKSVSLFLTATFSNT